MFDVFQTLKTRVMPQQAQGSELTFGFGPTLRIIVTEKRDKFVQRTITLLL